MSDNSSGTQALIPKLRQRWFSLFLAPFRWYMKRNVSKIHRNFFQWYCDHFYPIRDHISDTEWEYLQACFSMAEVFSEQSHEDAYDEYSYFTYSQRVKGSEVNASRFAFGSVANPAATLEAAMPVLEERQVPLDTYFLESPNSLFYGLGWDLMAQQFKVYFRILDFSQLPFPSLLAMLETTMLPEKRNSEGLVSFTYIGQEVHEEKIYAYPLPETDPNQDLFAGTKGRVVMATSKRGNITQYDVSTTKLWRQKLNATGRNIIDKYARSGYTLDTIAMQDNDNFTLYFPGAFFPFLSTYAKIEQTLRKE